MLSKQFSIFLMYLLINTVQFLVFNWFNLSSFRVLSAMDLSDLSEVRPSWLVLLLSSLFGMHNLVIPAKRNSVGILMNVRTHAIC